MVIIKKILFAGGACPYQIEAETDDGKFFYLRYRGGVLRFGVWENESKFDINNYMFSKRVGGEYDGWPDAETFDRELKDLVQFPEGFTHQDNVTDPNYPAEGRWQPDDEATKKILQGLLGGDESSSGPRNPIVPN